MSNYPGIKTGFGGFMRELLSYLHKTGKYELCMYSSGMPWEHPDFARWPWKTLGALPNNQQEIDNLNRDGNVARAAHYGAYYVDRAVQEFKPDVFIGSEDVWGVEFCKDKAWWNKISCVVHTTLDSLPILPSAIELARVSPNFFSWADFATQEMNKMGLENVKTIRGTVNTDVFRKLYRDEKINIRKVQGIPANAFCIGMVSRNQLRKSFGNLLEGYKMFKQQNPEIKNPRLLLYTHFSEGWDILRFCRDLEIDPSEVLATYKCRATGNYFVRPYAGQDLNNPETGHEKSLVTVNVQDGLTEEQLNEWYNILDVYCHPFTSGGQERGIQEAKLCELITLVTNYSCGKTHAYPKHNL